MKTLRFWIILLLSTAIVGIFSITFLSSYFITKKNLINDSLTINKNYAESLSKELGVRLNSIQSDLELMSVEVSALKENKVLLKEKLNNILLKESFDSISVVTKEGFVLDSAPYSTIVGKKLDTPGAQEALTKRKTIISRPFTSATGRTIILISTPIWDADNRYQGYLSGAIYLEEENFLEEILGDHFANNGSYVFVVDDQGNTIYHPDKQKIGENSKESDIAKKIIKHKSGTGKVMNIEGEEFIAGYSFMPERKWGVVSQTPYEVSIHPLSGIVLNMFLTALPFIVLLFILTLYLAQKLSAPLQKLALFSKYLEDNNWDRKKLDELPMWYFEARQLKKTIQTYSEKQQKRVEGYKNQSYTDTLTQLKNRRYFEEVTKKWVRNEQSFSVIMIDIDHFKEVNDTYGHQKGDEVLKFISNIMQDVVRERDLCIRLGGEEFIVLLFQTELQSAMNIAERLRENVASVVGPTNATITISAGATEYHKGDSIDDLYSRVDTALYRAKTSGRNKVIQN
ncbi:diguanylate cyclase [Chungangia koreensis]|uniref:Diguanylate cyclase n=1 Tax=Chungangia koreensis TaxID=752657 RepID=A0ABV8X6N4_9LACT